MPRTTVFVIVEGQTENAVLSRLLGSYLGYLGIDLHCAIVRLGRGRGGVKGLKCEEFCDQIQRFLKDSRQPFVTTFFDYYAFPHGIKSGWEFVARAKADVSFRGLDVTVQSIESELHRLAVTGLELPNIAGRFIPYIQLHELEALFFAEPEKMAALFEIPSLARIFANVVTECGSCEEINDNPQTAPSKRIQSLYSGYIKGRSDYAHGPRLADKLDLTTVRQACPRFSAWVTRLESLAPAAEPQGPSNRSPL